jgi:hypothetical protein
MVTHAKPGTNRVVRNHLASSTAESADKDHNIHTTESLCYLLAQLRPTLTEGSDSDTVLLCVFYKHTSTCSASERHEESSATLKLSPLDSESSSLRLAAATALLALWLYAMSTVQVTRQATRLKVVSALWTGDSASGNITV